MATRSIWIEKRAREIFERENKHPTIFWEPLADQQPKAKSAKIALAPEHKRPFLDRAELELVCGGLIEPD